MKETLHGSYSMPFEPFVPPPVSVVANRGREAKSHRRTRADIPQRDQNGLGFRVSGSLASVDLTGGPMRRAP